MAKRHLRSDKTGDVDARRIKYSRDVRIGGGEPSQLLSKLASTRTQTGRSGVTRCDPATRRQRSALWIPTNRAIVEARRMDRQSQARSADDAGGQPAEYSAAAIRGDNRQ